VYSCLVWSFLLCVHGKEVSVDILGILFFPLLQRVFSLCLLASLGSFVQRN
jgi:hypothetical protein